MHRRRKSLSADSGPTRRSLSADRGRRQQRRSPALSYSLSPRDYMPWNPDGGELREERREQTVRGEHVHIPSGALDRRTRRHKQAARENEVAQRQRDGRKPFYLTLDSHGIPYGLGKPAWVAEIGKLATGLDPSCTHISRQTYEAISTFKARLNQSFEYSGTLNDDHLRSLMGKAVTKKRTELISLIKKEGSQPLHIDHEVWERLVKLAASKQRENKSEQGRYANACRRTLGRTGSRGVNGIRERLRQILNRSPDPEEIEYEMTRDKGYGGYQKKSTAVGVQLKRELKEMSSDEDSVGSQSESPVAYQSMSDDREGSPENRLPRATNEVRATNTV